MPVATVEGERILASPRHREAGRGGGTDAKSQGDALERRPSRHHDMISLSRIEPGIGE
jgi:hypothetical protein